MLIIPEGFTVGPASGAMILAAALVIGWLLASPLWMKKADRQKGLGRIGYMIGVTALALFIFGFLRIMLMGDRAFLDETTSAFMPIVLSIVVALIGKIMRSRAGKEERS